jgi:glycosyltransferase involved in cell wall biosynthesis
LWFFFSRNNRFLPLAFAVPLAMTRAHMKHCLLKRGVAGRFRAMPTPNALHPLHRAWRLLPAAARRSAIARGSAWFAPRPAWPAPPVACGVAVAGEIGRASGLGEGARLMLAGLAALKIPHWAIDTGSGLPGDPPMEAEIRALPAGVPLVLHVNAPVLPAALLRLPRSLLRGRRIIGYWAWELPVAPATWASSPSLVHEIWAPSRFSAGALEPLAPGRVRVVPHPVAAGQIAPSALGRADFGLPYDAVIVLVSFSLASSFARKNPLAAVEAFVTAFGSRPDRLLLLKIVHAANDQSDLERIVKAVAGAPNIRIETRTFSPADSYALTRCCDIVLSLHRSEGFGLVPAEAMLLARPVIATDWSATAEFLDAGCGIPIPYRLVPADDPRGVFMAPGACWAEADIDAAAAALRRLADDPVGSAALGLAGQTAARRRLGTAGLEAALCAMGLAVHDTAA